MKQQRWIGFVLALTLSLCVTSPVAALPPLDSQLPVYVEFVAQFPGDTYSVALQGQ